MFMPAISSPRSIQSCLKTIFARRRRLANLEAQKRAAEARLRKSKLEYIRQKGLMGGRHVAAGFGKRGRAVAGG